MKKSILAVTFTILAVVGATRAALPANQPAAICCNGGACCGGGPCCGAK